MVTRSMSHCPMYFLPLATHGHTVHVPLSNVLLATGYTWSHGPCPTVQCTSCHWLHMVTRSMSHCPMYFLPLATHGHTVHVPLSNVLLATGYTWSHSPCPTVQCTSCHWLHMVTRSMSHCPMYFLPLATHGHTVHVPLSNVLLATGYTWSHGPCPTVQCTSCHWLHMVTRFMSHCPMYFLPLATHGHTVHVPLSNVLLATGYTWSHGPCPTVQCTSCHWLHMVTRSMSHCPMYFLPLATHGHTVHVPLSNVLLATGYTWSHGPCPTVQCTSCHWLHMVTRSMSHCPMYFLPLATHGHTVHVPLSNVLLATGYTWSHGPCPTVQCTSCHWLHMVTRSMSHCPMYFLPLATHGHMVHVPLSNVLLATGYTWSHGPWPNMDNPPHAL
ncbi:hypothetical protein OTU49_004810, partial [Cherax quadricarinatus]